MVEVGDRARERAGGQVDGVKSVVVVARDPRLAVAEGEAPSGARQLHALSRAVRTRVDADQLAVAVVESPQRAAVPADGVGRVAGAPAPRARVVGVDAVRRAALRAQNLGVGDRDRGHGPAAGAVDLGDGAVAHVGDERPGAAQRNGSGGLADRDVIDHGPAWGRGRRFGTGPYHRGPDEEAPKHFNSSCNRLTILHLLH